MEGFIIDENEKRIEEVFKLNNGTPVYLLDENKLVLKPRVYLKSRLLKEINEVVVRELTKWEFKEILERIKGVK